MNKVYLLLGGNLGDRSANLAEAAVLLSASFGAIEDQSKIYATAAWGKTDQPEFYNQALCIKTDTSPKEMLSTILAIERKIGRTRDGSKWSERLIDIDILLIGDLLIEEPELQVPHPYMQDRRFVLEPLAEIAGHTIHPRTNKTIHELLVECKDALSVRPL